MVPRFQDQRFSKRYKTLGNTSEECFDWWAQQNGVSSVQFGFNDPPFDYFQYLPRHVRQLPDRVCEDQGGHALTSLPTSVRKRHFSVEVKGVGRDKLVKLKKANVESLLKWQTFSQRPVFLFVYDSHLRRYSHLIHLRSMKDLEYTTGTFHDGPEYYAYHVDQFSWDDVPDSVRFEGEAAYALSKTS